MKTRTAAVTLALALFVAPGIATAQGVGGIAVRAFGAREWREAVATVAALPTCDTGSGIASENGVLRYAIAEQALYRCSGGAWAVALAGGGGVTDHGALTGLGDDDHGLYALDTDLSTHEGNASAHHTKTVDAAELTAGVLTHERGGLEADVSLYAGLVAISGGLASNVTDLAGLNTALGSSIADGAHTPAFTPNADPGVDHSGYVAGHGDGTDCDPGEYARGSDGSGNATGCTPDDAGTDDQTGAEVPLTDTGGFFTTDNVEAALQQVGPTMTDSRTPTAHRDSHETAGSDPLVDLAGEVITSGTVADARIASTIARDSEVPSLETDPGVPLLALADLGDLCAGGESTRRNAGDTANECYTPGGGAPSFDTITSGTNTTAAMVVSTGASLKVSGTGTIDASGIDRDGDGTREIESDGTRITFRNPASGSTAPMEIVAASNGSNDTLEVLAGSQSSIVRSGTGQSSGLLLTAAQGSAPVELRPRNNTLALRADTHVTSHVPAANAASAATCASSGDGNPGALTLAPSTSAVYLTNADPDGCAITLSETGAASVQQLTVWLVSHAGGNVTLSDSAGVQETGAGCTLTGLWGGFHVQYINADRWALGWCQPAN